MERIGWPPDAPPRLVAEAELYLATPEKEHLGWLYRARAFGAELLAVWGPDPTKPFPAIGATGRKGAILLIGDEGPPGTGPAGFHKPSLDAALRAAAFVAIMVGEPVPAVYRHVAETATIQGRLTVLIKCGEEVEADWYVYVERMAPDAGMVIATPIPEYGA